MAEAHAFYQDLPTVTEYTAIDLTQWHGVFEKMMRDTYDGKIKPGKLSREHIERTYQELNGGARKGYGKGWAKPSGASLPDPVVLRMKKNLYRFSQAKDYVMLEELNQLLYEGDRLASWEDFRTAALKLDNRYNVNYLQAEWQTARQSGHHANNWQHYEENRELFPNLKYRTQGDDRVRDEHRALDGIIAPINDPFWRKYYPPNGWRCRCYVVQTAEKPSNVIPENMPEVKPQFEINVGISGQVFNEGKKGHPYFALAREAGQELMEVFELDKLNAPYEQGYKAKNGAVVEVSIFADPADLDDNFETAKIIADDLKENISIRPHLNLKGHKNPEYQKGGIMGDRVRPTSTNVRRATSSLFSNKLGRNGQLAGEKKAFLVIDIWFDTDDRNVKDFITQSWSKFSYFKSLDHLVLVKDGKAKRISRQDDFADYSESVTEFLK